MKSNFSARLDRFSFSGAKRKWKPPKKAKKEAASKKRPRMTKDNNEDESYDRQDHAMLSDDESLALKLLGR